MSPRLSALPALAGASLALVLAVGCSSSAGGGGGGTPAVNTCPAPTGPATKHAGFVSADETWGPGLHEVTANVLVRAGVTLTVAPCAVVRLAKDVVLEVDDEAKGLVAEGTSSEPIVFERANAAEAWGSLLAYAPATVRLAYTTLRGGGTTKAGIGADFGGAALAARNQQTTRMDVLAVDHVTVEGASGVGVLLDSTGFVAGSRALTVTGSGSYPVYLGAARPSASPHHVLRA